MKFMKKLYISKTVLFSLSQKQSQLCLPVLYAYLIKRVNEYTFYVQTMEAQVSYSKISLMFLSFLHFVQKF